jgi:putative acetyltransferase
MEGLETCRRLSVEAVVVLGHPEHYPRFGFSSSAAAAIRSPFSGSPAFMAVEMTPGALRGAIEVHYPAAFG